ncbi:MAG: U32 family peptidase [Reinekea sp.]
MELVCPAGSLNAFKVAVENGADAVYLGFRNETNARYFAGLNFNDRAAQKALTLARSKGVRLFVAINTFANELNADKWRQAADAAVDLGADAIIAADTAVLEYVSQRYPQQPLHLSVQASATNSGALNFYYRHFNIRRAVLPRVLSLPQVEALCQNSPVELEVFAFGSLCVMAEGRCYLSSYLTGESPNTVGACSPARFVSWEENNGKTDARLNGALIDRFEANESAGYPTLCKGRFHALGKRFHALEEPTSLNQEAFTLDPEWEKRLLEVSEGSQTTIGAYHRQWQ